MPAPQDVVEVQSQDFPCLENILKAKLPTSGLIWNVLQLKQSLKADSKIAVKIYSEEPPEKWSVNTTTFMGVANVEGLPQNLVVFSGPKNGSSKSAVLRLLSALDWNRQNQFEGVENSIAPVVIEHAKKFGSVEEHDPIELYFMQEDEAMQILTEKDLKILSGSSLRGASLHPRDATMVQERWPEKRDGYLEMLRASIESCSSGGIYISKEETPCAGSSTDKNAWNLVSFAVALPFGSIHALHTEPDERRKGYGNLTMKILAQNIAKAGRIPLVQIYKYNDGSKALNLGVGFKYSHDINLIHFTPQS